MNDTPAAINRQAWAWVREFIRDLLDDYANRLESRS